LVRAESAIMRLKSITIRNLPPVRLFEAGDLSDVVIVAGPNGVGKTRLLQGLIQRLRAGSVTPDFEATIQATCEEERSAWGERDAIVLSDASDMAAFTRTLQAERLRSKWRSSLINIESDRSISQLRALQPSWEYANPSEEPVAWDQTIGFMRDRFQDTVHSIFRMIQAQDHGISTRAKQLKRDGRPSMNLDFDDPMAAFKDVFSLLLAPKQLADPVPSRGYLEYLSDGEVRNFSSLSSGETEVVNIAFDFLLRNPQDCIVFFDEPELHLHPELSYRMLQALRRIGGRNQFILSTHSPDVISASLQNSVLFLSGAPDGADEEPVNQAVPVNESDQTHQALKLLGQSIGIVALGKRIVLIEGTESSLDKQVYGAITKERWPGLVLVPSGGKHVVESFATVYDKVLSHSIWGVNFYMLCDGDSYPAGAPEAAKAAEEVGRLRLLPRYHLENYFLDEYVWADAFSDLEPGDSWLRSPERIRSELIRIARDLTSYATALAATAHLRLRVGTVDIMPANCHNKSIDELQALVLAEVTAERERVATTLEEIGVKQWVAAYYDQITGSLESNSDDWQRLIPGKPLLRIFASRCNLDEARARTLYMNHALTSERAPFAEILEIFEGFAAE
jgi:ABC-type cobalamin/Fe3+-siderophores transport system ATPase subunit